MSLPNSKSLSRTPFKVRASLLPQLRSYCKLNEAFEGHLWDEADRTLPTKSGYRTAAHDRRELRLALMMGGPL